MDQEQKHIISGVIVSTKMTKTVVAVVQRKVRDSLYGKFVKHSTRYFVHDDQEICKGKEGQTILFVPCRPLSKKKNWTLLKLVENNAQA